LSVGDGAKGELRGWHYLTQIPKLGESCPCSCSICGTLAPKREPDPSAIVLLHHSDREIRRILEDEHEQEHEHSTPISANSIVIARRLIVPAGRMRVAWHEVPGMASKEPIRPGGTG